VTSIDRTAYPRFKRMITTRELADSFSPSEEEIAWARGMTLSDSHLLALTVWLKSYQRLGYFPKLDEVPEVVVEHVRDALRLPADVMAEVDAPRTAKRHRESVRRRLRVKYNAAQARILAEEAIRAAAQTKGNPAGTGRGRPGRAGLQGRGRGPVQADPVRGRAGGGAGRRAGRVRLG
jgi:hypothetical protein